jgi:cysteinyl-tRNA synthetase
MPLRLYNTLTRQKEAFEPIDSSKVRLYACGPTVYDHLHIGNGRMLIVFDVLFRLLRREYGETHVTYVRNITDVDDKINARAAERGVDISVLTDEMTKVFHEDAKALGCLAPTVEPRATDHIAEMIALIEKLIAKGHAYVAEGHVLFDVPSVPAYGKLSKRPLDEMIAGARVEVAPYKRGPMDFVLWKPSSPAEPGWESPWGRGRPGWHIECSAMSWKHLGEVFDIHGGGIDLLFPHHENEMAQSCSAFGHDVMANFWMHNGHLQVVGEKMAKSLGNFVTIHELLHGTKFGGRGWQGQFVRFAMLQTHYTQPIDWTVKRLAESAEELGLWASYLARWYGELLDSNTLSSEARSALVSDVIGPSSGLVEQLMDDLNTAGAIAVMRKLFSNAERGDEESKLKLLMDCEFLAVMSRRRLGTLQSPSVSHGQSTGKPMSFEDLDLLEKIRIANANFNSDAKDSYVTEFERRGWDAKVSPDGNVTLHILPDERGGPQRERDEKIKSLIAAREGERKNKNWAEADRIRDELAKMGIRLQDNADGTTTLHYLHVGDTGRFELKGSDATLAVKK